MDVSCGTAVLSERFNRPESVATPVVRSRKVAIPALTGVRGVAACWIAFAHFETQLLTLFPKLVIVVPLLRSGYLAVDMFFVLSGFILSHTYTTEFRRVGRQAYMRFLGFRLARMYPVHLITLLVLLAGVLVGQRSGVHFNMPARLGVADFIRNLLLIQIWTPSHELSWNAPAWSISAEWFAYLLFPVISLAAVRVRSARLALAGAATSLAILVALAPVELPHPLIRVTFEFVAGCLLYRLYTMNWQPRIPWEAVAAALVTLLLAYIYVGPHFGIRMSGMCGVPIVALMVLALANSSTGIAGFLTLAPMMFLGEVSYSLYMTHDVLRMVLPKLIPLPHYANASFGIRSMVLILYILLIGMAAVGTYLVVEKPGRNRIRRLIDWCSPAPQKARV